MMADMFSLMMCTAALLAICMFFIESVIVPMVLSSAVMLCTVLNALLDGYPVLPIYSYNFSVLHMSAPLCQYP